MKKNNDLQELTEVDIDEIVEAWQLVKTHIIEMAETVRDVFIDSDLYASLMDWEETVKTDREV